MDSGRLERASTCTNSGRIAFSTPGANPPPTLETPFPAPANALWSPGNAARKHECWWSDPSSQPGLRGSSVGCHGRAGMLSWQCYEVHSGNNQYQRRRGGGSCSIIKQSCMWCFLLVPQKKAGRRQARTSEKDWQQQHPVCAEEPVCLPPPP